MTNKKVVILEEKIEWHRQLPHWMTPTLVTPLSSRSLWPVPIYRLGNTRTCDDDDDDDATDTCTVYIYNPRVGP